MSDDSFIREVNEEIRQDRAKALWDRYGPAAIVVAVLVVLATAAWVGFDFLHPTATARIIIRIPSDLIASLPG